MSIVRNSTLWGAIIPTVGLALIVTKVVLWAGMSLHWAFVTYGIAAVACLVEIWVVLRRRVAEPEPGFH